VSMPSTIEIVVIFVLNHLASMKLRDFDEK
jgi:hypothetical protein